ncbi:MAG TPA: sulfatase-like hydrolase/transferase [Candidatus Hydrogenedentes bacterium]|nr:sulfatase-like hydrolase/transferase [Candidatus Hydrogenedentota bacterium]
MGTDLVLALYIVSLGVSAGLAGLFAQEVLVGQGYVPGFRTSIMLVGGVACGYLCVQTLYMAVVRMLKPTKAWPHLFAETLSHLGTLIFLPYVFRVQVDWPDPLLEKVEPLVYVGAFVVVHGFFKLTSFFAALRARPSGRFGALGWAGLCAVSAFAAHASLTTWFRETEAARPRAPVTARHWQVGDAHALGREMPEGSVLEFALDCYPGQCLTLRFAPAPAAGPETASPDSIYVTVFLDGDESKRFSGPVRLTTAGWSELRVPADIFPDRPVGGSISWGSQREPGWRRVLGLRPMAMSNRKVLFSGPFQHEERRPETEDPNLLVLVVEGLGARHVSCLGYDRETTPAIDRELAPFAHTFTNAYTAAPETAAAAMTVLTGLDPLAHRYLGAAHGPLPERFESLAEVLLDDRYATAAFTEGEGERGGGLVFGSGFERGFEFFDASYRSASGDAAGGVTDSSATLEKVHDWVDAHSDGKFFAFVCLRELCAFEMRERYAPGFVGERARPAPRDVYDSALAYLDGRIGDLIARIRNRDTRRNTCIVLTSTHGFDFTGKPDAAPKVGLVEDVLHVPLIIYVPGLKKTPRPELVALEDVAPTLAHLAGVRFSSPVAGRSFFEPAFLNEPISVFGDPLAVSIRTERWRFTWQTRRRPFGAGMAEADEATGLYDVRELTRQGWTRNAAAQYPRIVSGFQKQLEEHLDTLSAPSDD